MKYSLSAISCVYSQIPIFGAGNIIEIRYEDINLRYINWNFKIITFKLLNNINKSSQSKLKEHHNFRISHFRQIAMSFMQSFSIYYEYIVSTSLHIFTIQKKPRIVQLKHQ